MNKSTSVRFNIIIQGTHEESCPPCALGNRQTYIGASSGTNRSLWGSHSPSWSWWRNTRIDFIKVQPSQREVPALHLNKKEYTFWCIAEKKSFAWPPKQHSCEAELASGDLSHGGNGRMVGESLATAAMWNAAGEADYCPVAPRALRLGPHDWGEGDQEGGRREYQRALREWDSCWLLSGLQQEAHLWAARKTSSKDSPTWPGGTLKALRAKPALPPHSAADSWCLLLSAVEKASSAEQVIPSENWPGSVGKRGTTNWSFSATFWKTRGRLPTASLVSSKNQKSHKI